MSVTAINHSMNILITPHHHLLHVRNDSFMCQVAFVCTYGQTSFVTTLVCWAVLLFTCVILHCWMNDPSLHYWYYTDLPDGWLSPTNHTLTLEFRSSTTFVTVIASWWTCKKTINHSTDLWQCRPIQQTNLNCLENKTKVMHYIQTYAVNWTYTTQSVLQSDTKLLDFSQ